MSKQLFDHLDGMSLLEYGAVFPAELVRECIGITYPKVASRETFLTLELTELSAISYVRNKLLGQGKYLSRTGSDYRILLPSENAKQVERYLVSASGKLKRGLRLSKNSPATQTATTDIEAKLLCKKEYIEDAISHAKKVS